MSGMTVPVSSYRRASSTPDAPGLVQSSARVRFVGISRSRKNRSPRLWRSDRSNLVANQLPAGGRFCKDDAALELAAGGFAAVLALDGDATDRDRGVATVDPDFYVRITFDGAEVGSARFQVCQALGLSNNRAAGVDEGVIIRPNPFERGGIPFHQGGAVFLDHLSHFLLGGFGFR